MDYTIVAAFLMMCLLTYKIFRYEPTGPIDARPLIMFGLLVVFACYCFMELA